MTTLAYLGPEGTFTEAALRSHAPDARGLPYPTVAAALEAVRQGDVSGAVVPVENSIEGPVTVTLDELSAGAPLLITAEVLVPVRFALLVRPGTTLESVKRILTHPVAHAQCRTFLAAKLPHAEVLQSGSTAG